MSILIKGMEMPSTGLYFISVDNTGGRDKTIVTVERMLGNRDVRQVIGSFELVPVTPHGRLIDADALDIYRREEQAWHDYEVFPEEYLEGVKDGKLIENLPPNIKPTIFGMAVKADYALPDDYDFLVQHEPPQPITNADKIRASSDEELADWLIMNGNGSDYQTWLDWLREVATDGEQS